LVGIPFFTTLTVLFTYSQLLLIKRVGGSVLPSASFHGAINALWGITMIATRLPIEVGELMLGLGLIGIMAWAILDVMIYALDKKVFPGELSED
jgi:hypothetical protein